MTLAKLIAAMAIALISTVSVVNAPAAQERRQRQTERGDRGRDRGRGRGGQRRYRSDRVPGWRYEPGQGWYDPNVAIGTAIGTGLGSWLSRQFQKDVEPVEEESDEAELTPWSPGWIAYCKRKYKSFDIKDGRYLSFDGNRYFCNPNK